MSSTATRVIKNTGYLYAKMGESAPPKANGVTILRMQDGKTMKVVTK